MGLTNLREQLLKAGLVTPEQARAAEAVRSGKRSGRPSGPAAGNPVPTIPPPSATAPEPAPEAELAALVAEHRLTIRIRGPRRWYFLGRQGRVPYTELSEEAAARLETGQAGLVEAPTGEVTLVDPEAAARLRQLGSAWLRHWVS